MGKLKKISVHIADDHKVLIDGIKAVLKTENQVEVVACSLDGQQVIDWYKTNSSDVLVLDINMPKIDGIKVLQYFRKQKTQPRIIVLSSYDDIKLVQEVLKMGAVGFLAKKCAAEQIIDAILRVSEGEQYFSDEIRSKIFSLFSSDRDQENTSDYRFFSSLTNREKEILKLISKEFSSKEIANELDISIHTVETYRKNLIKKLKVKNVVGLALYAHKYLTI